MTYIQSIGTAVPNYQYKQEELAGFMSSYLEADQRLHRLIRVLYSRSGIETRYSVIPDFSKQYQAHHLFNGTQASVSQRMQVFSKEAVQLGVKAVRACTPDIELEEVTHLIPISCTGMSAPGLDIQLQKELGLRDNCVRLSVNFMGCYAAFHGLKMADFICRADPGARVLVVAVEMCSLHFLKDVNEDNLRANALFSDGAAAVLLSGTADAERQWKVDNFHSRLLSKGESDMAWEIGEEAFKMRLSSYIPELVKEGIQPLIDGCLKGFNCSPDEISEWAIHPGGIRILEAVEQELNLDSETLAPSRKILRQYGNMSSPTILFVLKEMWEQNKASEGKIFSAGFGPGLTLESCLIDQNPDAR